MWGAFMVAHWGGTMLSRTGNRPATTGDLSLEARQEAGWSVGARADDVGTRSSPPSPLRMVRSFFLG
jgi:hypothetical protein